MGCEKRGMAEEGVGMDVGWPGGKWIVAGSIIGGGLEFEVGFVSFGTFYRTQFIRLAPS